MGHRYELLAQLDGVTIQFLTSRVPKISVRDLKFLEVRMSKEELFPDIDNSQDRVEIWERLKNIDYPIPTLETFFQDRLILEVGRSVLQRICIPDPQRNPRSTRNWASNMTLPFLSWLQIDSIGFEVSFLSFGVSAFSTGLI